MKRKIILFFALAVMAIQFSSCVVDEHGHRHWRHHHHDYDHDHR